MKSHSFRHGILVWATALVALLAQATEVRAQPPLDRKNMDPSVRPGDDFYRYANGQWIKNLELPADRSSYDAFTQVRDQNRDRLHGLFEKLAGGARAAAKGSPEQKVGDFYAAAMDTKRIEALGAAPLQEELGRVARLATPADVQALVAAWHRNGITVLFGAGFEVSLADSKKYAYYLVQGGLGLPDRDYYTKEDAESRKIQAQYVDHVTAMFTLLGDAADAAAASARAVMAIETRLARASKTNVEMRDIPGLYNPMTRVQLQQRAPGLDWARYLQESCGKDVTEFIVMSPKFITDMAAALTEVSVADWKAYLRWHLLNGHAAYLSAPFVDESFRFFARTLQGTQAIQDRWKRMTTLTSESLGELVGQMYVAQYFPPTAKARMEDLAANLKRAFAGRIKNLSWMSDATKKEALSKLEGMKVEVGYPSKWEDYSTLEIGRDSLVGNLWRVGRHAYEKNIERFGKPVDPTKWDMTPQTVNAGYNPLHNRMVFPAGILQPPFFFPDGDDAVNYGAIGMAIGHEMSHGFDDQGRHFDRTGNMRDWWTKEDATRFKQLTDLLVRQYNGFTAVGDTKVNGELTLGENIADFAGLTIAYDAYRLSLASKPRPQPIDGLNDGQRFFLAYAQLWRGKIRDEALKRLVQGDVHPWGEFRVNGAPFNIPEFYTLFDIKPGDKLYRTPEQRPVLW